MNESQRVLYENLKKLNGGCFWENQKVCEIQGVAKTFGNIQMRVSYCLALYFLL